MPSLDLSGTVQAAPDDTPDGSRVGSGRLPRVARRAGALTSGPETYEAAFPELHGVAYRAAHRITRDGHRSEEIAQEAMVRAYLKWGKLHDETYRAAFVARVATNLAISAYHRQATTKRFAPVLEASTPRRVVDDSDARIRLQEALRALPRRQREVVMLRVLADQSEADTAAVLGCTVPAVRHHLAAAIRALRVYAVADLIGQPDEDAIPAASLAKVVQTGADRRAQHRKVRGVVAGVIAFVVAALGSGLAGFGPVPLRSDDAKDRRDRTTTTTTTAPPSVATTVIIGPNGAPIVVPVVPGRAPGASGSNVPPSAAPAAGPASSGTPEPDGTASTPGPTTAVGFPSPTTTGVPTGTALTPVGSLTIRTPGTVVDGKQINGCVSIEAPNVTIRNSVIRGDCYFVVTTSDVAINTVLERVEISGTRTSSTTCVLGDNLDLRAVYIHDCVLGFMPGRAARLDASYISASLKAVYCEGCADLVVTRSNLEAIGGTAAVQMDSARPIGAVSITGSRLNGGQYALYGAGATSGQIRNAPTLLTLTGNVFGPSFSYGYAADLGPNVVWADNTVERTGAILPRP